MYLLLVSTLLSVCNLGQGVTLLRRDLTRYPLARCNDGTTAAYYHEKDVRQAGDKVLIFLPDGGDCSSVSDCTRRCKDSPALCSKPIAPVVEREGGIWSGSFSQYFKIFIHYCSSDSFAGTQPSSPATGNITFHGRHILTATLQDLVARLGIERAGSVVLAGSGSGARGVGYNCDFVRSALVGVNQAVDVRCLADSPDFVPWWVKTEEQQCQGRDLQKLEREKTLWRRADDSSCVKNNEASPSLSYRCGVLSQYWQDINTPLLIIASQYDPVYYESSPCIPGVATQQYRHYRAAWEKGVIGLVESVLARSVNKTSLFIPSCAGHTFLTEGFMVGVQVGEPSLTLREMISRWLKTDGLHAIDSLGRENTQCPTPAPLKAPCGNLLGCGTRSGVPGRKQLYHARSFNSRLLPPASLFPKTYTRKCDLDPWYGSCRRGFISSARGDNHGLDHAHAQDVAHTVAQAEASRRRRLWQKLYYLQYLKKLFRKYRLAYEREYHADTTVVREKVVPAVLRPSRPVLVAPRRVPSVVAVERPTVAKVPDIVPGLDYDYEYDYDYSPVDYDYALHDYADYYDYSQSNCNTDCALSKIARAFKLRKKKGNSDLKNIDSPGQGEELLENFKDFLKESDLEYEDFGQLNTEVETFDKELLKLQERRKSLV